MILLHACPRCSGPLDDSGYPGERTCITCGYVSYVEGVTPFQVPMTITVRAGGNYRYGPRIRSES